MAAKLHPENHIEVEEEEDYIDMEISSTSHFFCHPRSTYPRKPSEFEFQMFPTSSEREATSPADELFHKWKILPLHLEKLLENSTPYIPNTKSFEDEDFNTLLANTTYTTPLENTPFDSCQTSPYGTPQMSKELNASEYFSDYFSGSLSSNNGNKKKSWGKKLKLGQKLKASHAYLKSFFNKKSENELESKTTCKSLPYSKSFKTEKVIPNNNVTRHRRSFSGAIRRFSTTKALPSSNSSSSFGSSLSSSSSGDSNGLSDLSSMKTSTCGRSDVESSIQGAIAHCKRSQHDFWSRKAVSTEFGFYQGFQ